MINKRVSVINTPKRDTLIQSKRKNKATQQGEDELINIYVNDSGY